MGYGISTTLMYGVEPGAEDSTRLLNAIGDILSAEGDDTDLYDWLQERGLAMVAEDSDSRIHDNTYEPGFTHFFGVFLADKGYGGGSNEDFRAAQATLDPEAVETFKEVCQPILDAAGIKEVGGVQVASCTV